MRPWCVQHWPAHRELKLHARGVISSPFTFPGACQDGSRREIPTCNVVLQLRMVGAVGDAPGSGCFLSSIRSIVHRGCKTVERSIPRARGYRLFFRAVAANKSGKAFQRKHDLRGTTVRTICFSPVVAATSDNRLEWYACLPTAQIHAPGDAEHLVGSSTAFPIIEEESRSANAKRPM